MHLMMLMAMAIVLPHNSPHTIMYPTNPINVAQLSDTSALSHAELQNLVSNLRFGKYPCRMVKATTPNTDNVSPAVDERIAMS